MTVSLRRRSVDCPPTLDLHCKKMLVLVICCTNEISCAHRLHKIRGNIGDNQNFCREIEIFSKKIHSEIWFERFQEMLVMYTAAVAAMPCLLPFAAVRG